MYVTRYASKKKKAFLVMCKTENERGGSQLIFRLLRTMQKWGQEYICSMVSSDSVVSLNSGRGYKEITRRIYSLNIKIRVKWNELDSGV